MHFTVRTPAEPNVRRSFENKAHVRVGRAPDNDLMVDRAAVSAHHAELRSEGGRWLLVDLRSRAGTKLNGRRIHQPAALAPGDEIAVGDSVIVFEGEQVGESLPAIRSIADEAEPMLVGDSTAMRSVRAMIDKVARADSTVLITGESGTGKEIVARLIHRRSHRAAGPFVVVNCPALPGSLIEPELFGIEKRIATGVDARRGQLESAARGTVLLDEIGDLEASAQAKLLRFIQDKTVERVGGLRPIQLDVRILASTHADLATLVEQGRFRLDLYHRLNTVTIRLPPLRERRDDIPTLVEHFLARGGGARLAITPEAQARLVAHPFPGNVRELERTIERSQLLSDGPLIRAEDLPSLAHAQAHPQAQDHTTLSERVEQEAGLLHDRIVRDGESFWDVVHAPFMRRALAAEVVHCLIERGYREGTRSNRKMARLFGLDSLTEYKRFTAFLRNHGLLISKRPRSGRN